MITILLVTGLVIAAVAVAIAIISSCKTVKVVNEYDAR